ncbi:MAG TPA: hypothetical protein VGX03_36470 [Candidatus Binatia bacterium]|jgi:hypothetical protein|nr:hypothetical protein [Candidatus Binatia bacterium]
MRSLSVARASEEKCENRHSLLTEEVQAFFEQYLSPAVLEVFPDWQGILLACDELAGSVWIVRSIQDGQQLHAATGQPALLLADLLAQKGRDFAEAWKVLQPCLIFSHGENLEKGKGSDEKTARKRTEERS